MFKKFFAIAILAAFMTSCGYSVDGVVDDINKCQNAAELMKISSDKDLQEWYKKLPKEDQKKIDDAAEKKAAEFASSATSALEEVL